MSLLELIFYWYKGNQIIKLGELSDHRDSKYWGRNVELLVGPFQTLPKPLTCLSENWNYVHIHLEGFRFMHYTIL